jgi:hypothetical protein
VYDGTIFVAAFVFNSIRKLKEDGAGQVRIVLYQPGHKIIQLFMGKFGKQFFRAYFLALAVLPAPGVFCYPFGNGILNNGDMFAGVIITGAGTGKISPALSIGVYLYGIHAVITLILCLPMIRRCFP